MKRLLFVILLLAFAAPAQSTPIIKIWSPQADSNGVIRIAPKEDAEHVTWDDPSKIVNVYYEVSNYQGESAWGRWGFDCFQFPWLLLDDFGSPGTGDVAGKGTSGEGMVRRYSIPPLRWVRLDLRLAYTHSSHIHGQWYFLAVRLLRFPSFDSQAGQ